MSRPSYKKLAQLAGGKRKTMKCHYRKESLACAFHYNGLCLRDHNYECPGLAMKNLSHGEMVQIAEGKKNKTPRYIDANKLKTWQHMRGHMGMSMCMTYITPLQPMWLLW